MLSHRFRTSASPRTRKTPSRWSLYCFNGLLVRAIVLSDATGPHFPVTPV